MNIYAKILFGLGWLGGLFSGFMICSIICGGFLPGAIMFGIVVVLLWLSYMAQG